MVQKHQSSFRGKVGEDAKKSMRVSRGYLNLPEGVKQYSIKENEKLAKFDILPYVVSDPKHPCRDESRGIAMVGDLWYRRPIKVHNNVGADDEKCICPKTFGKPCPICEHQKKRFNEGADKEETKALYAKDRNLYVLAIEDQIYVWDMSQALFQDTLKDALEVKPAMEIFPDLEEGKTLEVTFKWKTLGKNSFPEATHIEFLDRQPYDQSVLDMVPDLDTIFKVLTYDEIYNKFFEISDGDISHDTLKGDGEGEAEPPARERKSLRKAEPEAEKKTLSRRSAPEPEKEKDPAPTWDELKRLSRRNLVTMVNSNNLDIQVDDIADSDEGDDELREYIAKAMGSEIPGAEPEKKAPLQRQKPTPEPEKKSLSRAATTTARSEAGGKDKCPYGHTFGVDTDSFKDCTTCELWDACTDQKEKK